MFSSRVSMDESRKPVASAKKSTAAGKADGDFELLEDDEEGGLF